MGAAPSELQRGVNEIVRSRRKFDSRLKAVEEKYETINTQQCDLSQRLTRYYCGYLPSDAVLGRLEALEGFVKNLTGVFLLHSSPEMYDGKNVVERTDEWLEKYGVRRHSPEKESDPE